MAIKPVLTIVGLGGNLGKPLVTLKKAISKIKLLGSDFRVSKFYLTKPVSSLEQPHFINAVCSFKTLFDPNILFLQLETIEKQLGKVKKPKDAPRLIDLDILFFGDKSYQENGLIIPHAKWKERLFVLTPLLDLIQEVYAEEKLWNIKEMIEGFPQEEIIEVYDETGAY